MKNEDTDMIRLFTNLDTLEQLTKRLPTAMDIQDSEAQPQQPEDPVKILQVRLARGEITPDNYQSGFAKPVDFEQKILLLPYYEIEEEQITEDVTDKERPGEVIPQIKLMQVQKLRYIIDVNVYANQGLILVCRVDTIDHAQQILEEYLQTTGLDGSCIRNFLYGQPSGIVQQLLLTLYDYWPTTESQVTSIRIGGKTISAKYSGRGRYDVRLEDINEEIRSRITAGEQIESMTIKPPVSIGGGGIKIRRAVPKITINDIGVIACRANTNYENFTLIKGFIRS